MVKHVLLGHCKRISLAYIRRLQIFEARFFKLVVRGARTQVTLESLRLVVVGSEVRALLRGIKSQLAAVLSLAHGR
jgi:hypothetical protein